MEHKIKRTMAFISTKNDGDKLLIADAIEWADKTMIDKACEWIQCMVLDYMQGDITDVKWGSMLADFREAMEE